MPILKSVLSLIVLLAGIGLMAVTPALCAEGPVTLTVIMEEVPDYDIVTRLTPEFEAKHPDIKIKFEAMPYDAMRDKILTSFLAPTATYEIIIVDNPWMDEFAEAGFLTPLDTYLSNTAHYDFEDFVKCPTPFPELGI